jgi:hypothetical protein
MVKTMVTRAAVAILVGAALTPVGAAAAQNGTTRMHVRAQPQAQGTDQPVVLRRDGSKAVPFEARWAGEAGEDGVHGGDGLIGVAGALGLVLLASATLLSGRRERLTQRLAQRGLG